MQPRRVLLADGNRSCWPGSGVFGGGGGAVHRSVVQLFVDAWGGGRCAFMFASVPLYQFYPVRWLLEAQMRVVCHGATYYFLVLVRSLCLFVFPPPLYLCLFVCLSCVILSAVS